MLYRPSYFCPPFRKCECIDGFMACSYLHQFAAVLVLTNKARKKPSVLSSFASAIAAKISVTQSSCGNTTFQSPSLIMSSHFSTLSVSRQLQNSACVGTSKLISVRSCIYAQRSLKSKDLRLQARCTRPLLIVSPARIMRWPLTNSW